MILAKDLPIQQIIYNIKNAEMPVIIFGASIVGEVLFKACKEAGINVECFCDNNTNKTKSTKCGIRVICASELKNKYQDAIFLISAAEIKDVVEQLESLGCSKWYSCSPLLREFDIYQYQFSAPMDFVEYAVASAILCHDNYLTPDKIFIRSVDIIITERCSQKCKDCSNLMQYYKKPQNCNIDEIIKDISTFCGIVDEINEFRVIGGEPFVNPDFDLVVKRLIEEIKVKKIIIYTNGTIVPSDEKLKSLKNDKVLVIITNYGRTEKKLNNLVKKLSDNGSAFYVQKAGGWTDCAKIAQHNRSLEKQKEIFRNCCAKNTITLSNGNLFRCPFAANAARLKAVPDFKDDYINIFDTQADKIEMRKRIRDYLS
ncbi:MAG: radical SAM protein, partial [Candidatus Omnitrophica bacterium]|nr:radical SAM protein [Candidatus Omnitrophota bacterium]